jgi:hypothetical protein
VDDGYSQYVFGVPLMGRSAVRCAIAALLYWLRPREVRWEPAANF